MLLISYTRQQQQQLISPHLIPSSSVSITRHLSTSHVLSVIISLALCHSHLIDSRIAEEGGIIYARARPWLELGS